jgi:hypothetical protein
LGLREDPEGEEEEGLLLRTLLLHSLRQVPQQCQRLVVTPIRNQLLLLWKETDLFVNVENRRPLVLPRKRVRTKDGSSSAVRNPMGTRERYSIFLFHSSFCNIFCLVVDSLDGLMKMELEVITPVSPLQRNIRETRIPPEVVVGI